MKIVFSGAGIVEMSGKAQGTIIQKSYGGYQLRKLTLPNRRQTAATQGKRKNFAFVNSSWRSLTNEQRETWISAAPEGVSGFEFYSSYNLGSVNAGGIIIPEFTAPVPNPVAEVAPFINRGFVAVPPVGTQSFQFISGNNSIPVGDWRPSFLWTGFISSSVYSYPKVNRSLLVLPDYITSSSYLVGWSTDGIDPAPPPGLGWKCKFLERWINEVTGQIYTRNMYELIYGDISSEGGEFDVSPYAVSGTLTGSPGAYTLDVVFESSSGNFNHDDWSPYFFYNQWGTETEAYEGVALTEIPVDKIAFTLPTYMSLRFSDNPADLPPPAAEGQWVGIWFNWINDITGEVSNNGSAFIQAVDF